MIKSIFKNIVTIFRERYYAGMALVLFFLFIVCICIYTLSDNVLTFVLLRKECKYTISTENKYVGRGRGASGGSTYYYKVDGEVYTVNGAPMDGGNHYFIKYYPPNPERSSMTGKKANANDVKNLPPGGYKELPHSVE